MLTPPTVAKRQQASQELAGRGSPEPCQPLAEAGALPTSSASAEARSLAGAQKLLRSRSLGAGKLHPVVLREAAGMLGRGLGVGTLSYVSSWRLPS